MNTVFLVMKVLIGSKDIGHQLILFMIDLLYPHQDHVCKIIILVETSLYIFVGFLILYIYQLNLGV